MSARGSSKRALHGCSALLLLLIVAGLLAIVALPHSRQSSDAVLPAVTTGSPTGATLTPAVRHGSHHYRPDGRLSGRLPFSHRRAIATRVVSIASLRSKAAEILAVLAILVLVGAAPSATARGGPGRGAARGRAPWSDRPTRAPPLLTA